MCQLAFSVNRNHILVSETASIFFFCILSTIHYNILVTINFQFYSWAIKQQLQDPSCKSLAINDENHVIPKRHVATNLYSVTSIQSISA